MHIHAAFLHTVMILCRCDVIYVVFGDTVVRPMAGIMRCVIDKTDSSY